METNVFVLFFFDHSCYKTDGKHGKRVCRYHTLYRRRRTRNIRARVRADSAAELHELRDAATKSRDKAAARVAHVAAAAYRLRQQHTIILLCV